MTEKIAFDPGIGELCNNFYAEVYIIENDLANMPQYPRKARYYSAVCKKILKSLINVLSFYNGCLAWAYYISKNHHDAEITGNPFLTYTEEQKAQYAPTEVVDFIIEYLDKFESDLKYYHIKNVSVPENAISILNLYRVLVSENEGFINTKNVADIKLPENLKFAKSDKEIKKMIDEAVENKNLNELINL